MPVTVYPRGTTIYQPEKCYNGYTVVLAPGETGADAALINMNGEAVHHWKMDPAKEKGGIPRVRLLRNGCLLVLRQVAAMRQTC